MAITLYSDGFYISPFVFSIFVALEEKGLPYQLQAVNLHQRQQHAADYRDKSILGRVPALEHDGFTLAESGAILEYLEDVFPTPRILPADLHERARARMVLHWLRTDLNQLREERGTHTMFFTHADQPLTAAGQAAATRLVETATRLIPDGATALGKSWSIADSDLAFMLQRLGLNGHELPAKLRAFVDAQWARPAVQKWVKLERKAFVPY